MGFLSQLVRPNDGKTRFRAVPVAGRSSRPVRRLLVEALEPRRLLSGLTLTAAGLADGFGLTTFATGFPEVGKVGPLGVAFPTTGGVLVSDYPGNLRVFPTDTDGQNAASITPINNFGAANAAGLAQFNGTIYMTQQSLGDVAKLINNGASTQVVVSGIPHATGVLVDPFSNLLYLGDDRAGAKIDVVDPVAKTVNVFQNVLADGLSLSPDGKTLYAAIVGGASAGHVLGFDLTTKAMVFDSGAISGGVDGTAVGKGPVTGNLFVNTNSGTVVEVNLATAAQTLIASGGSRGDFVTVDPNNGTLLLTQSDRIMRLVPGVFAIPQLATTTTLDVAPKISSFGQPVTLTAVVATAGTGTPTGTVTFTIDGQAQAPVSLTEVGGSDQATFTTSTLTPGTYTITAAYSGDFTFASSGSAPVSQLTVTPEALTITATSNTKVYDGTTSAAAVPTITSGSLVAGDTPNFTENYSNWNVGNGLMLAPGGTVDDGNGGNDYTYTFVPVSTGVITPAPLTIAAENQTKVYGAAMPTLTATYRGLVDGHTPASLTKLPTLTTSATPSSPVMAGGYPITVSGAVDPDYIIRYATGTLTVTPATPTITVKAPGGTFDTSPFPASVTLSGTGSDNKPTASLENVSPKSTYYAGAGTSGTDLGSTPPSAPGTYTVVVSFPGSADYAATQSSPITFTIVQAQATISLTSSGAASVHGQLVAFTASVTGAGTPTGSVTFTDGGAVLGTVELDSSGKAALTTSSLATGSQPIIASYSGSTDFASAASAPTTVAVARAGTHVVLETQSVRKKKKVVSLTLDATLAPLTPGAGVPTGTVTFELMQKKNKVKVLGTAPLSGGSATLTVKPRSVLKKSITIIYGGDADFQASNSTASILSSGTAALVRLIPTPVFRWPSRDDFR